MDDKKEAVAMTPLSDHKFLITEKVTTIYEVQKRTEKFTTSEEAIKGTDEINKQTENITATKDVDKGTEKLEDMKEAVVKIRGKDSDKFEGHYKGSTGWFNLNSEFFLKKYFYNLTRLLNNLSEKDIKVQDTEPYKQFFLPFDFTKLDLHNIKDPVKHRASSSDKGGKSKEIFVTPTCDKITSTEESNNTQQLTNGPNLITKLEAPSPELIVVDKL